MVKIKLLLLILAFFCSCENQVEENINVDVSNPIIGTWGYSSSIVIENGDTTITEFSEDQKGIKIINDSHFAFLIHDKYQGKNENAAANFVAGGGTYNFDGTYYTESLEYCSDRAWENHEFKFRVEVKGDTLLQSGEEKVEETGEDRFLIERYIRIR